MQTQTKPQKPGETGSSREINFLFIEGDRVVGHITADCCNCAWNDGHPRWPGAGMACILEELASEPFPLTCVKTITARMRERQTFHRDRERRN